MYHIEIVSQLWSRLSDEPMGKYYIYENDTKELTMNMEITEIKVFPVNEERLKAYVTITLNDCFVIRDLKIIQGHSGLFVAMPSKKRKDGQFRDIAHPLNQETRVEVEKAVFQAYEDELKGIGDNLGEVAKKLNS